MLGMLTWPAALRALRSPNYRLFFTGQSISLIGTWMTRIATSWLVYRMTDSAFLLGLVSFAGQIPAFFISPIAGVWIDRWDRHRTLLWTQVLSMLQSFALAALALTGTIRIWSLVVLVLMQGLINAFDMPTRQAFVIEMVMDRGLLGNAIALNSSMVNGARLFGPAIGGIVIAAVGEGYCFLIDGISYIAVIISLLMMRFESRPARGQAKRVLYELHEGWNYIVHSDPIRSILFFLALVNLIGPYTVLMPIVAGTILHGGAHTLGFLMGASGVGALISAISLALRRTVLGLGRMIAISSAMFGAGLMGLGFSRMTWISMLLMLITGFGLMQQMAASNTILQTIVDDHMRGRVMSFYTVSIMGITPIGSLLAGAYAAHFGAPVTLITGGACVVAGAAWFARKLPQLRRLIRPIYRSLGILPEVAAGLQTTNMMDVPPER